MTYRIKRNDPRRSFFGISGKGLIAALLLSVSATALADVELSASFNGPASYTPGTSATYTLTITNNGTTAENALTVVTNFPAGAVVTNVSCMETGTTTDCDSRIVAGNLNTNTSDVDASGGAVEYELTVAFDSDLSVSPLTVTADISSSDATPPTDPQASSTIDREADLSVLKTSPNSDYTPGGIGSFEIVVANAGPSDASNVRLTDTAPAGMTIASWNCTGSSCPSANGTGDIDETLDIAAGESLTFALQVTYASSLQTDPIENTADIDVPAVLNDPDTNDQSSTASLDRVPVLDMSLSFVAATVPTVYVPGTNDEVVEFTVSNLGPSDSAGAELTLVQDDAISNLDWICTPASVCTPSTGTGPINADLDLTAGATATIELTLDFDSGARGDLTLDPVIAAVNETDSVAANNADTQTIAAERRADVSVVKTASAGSVNPGGSFTYDIVITNLGPSDLGPDPDDPATADEQGVLLTDLFDPALLGALSCAETDFPCWVVCANDLGIPGDYTGDAASCPTTPRQGSGNIEGTSLALAANSSTTLVAEVRLNPNASGDIVNVASVELFSGMGAQVIENTTGGGSDSSSVTTPIELSSDIVVTKTDSATTAVAGEEHSYTIEVRNAGFATANNITLSDTFPIFDPVQFPGAPDNAGFQSGTVEWSCRSFDGACCISGTAQCGADEPTTDIGDVLAQAIDLPGQSRVEFTVTGLIDPRASGTLVNEASVTLSGGVSDPDLSNNSSIDNDTVLVRSPVLVVDKSSPTVTSINDDDLPPFRLVYEILVANNGPSFVPDVSVTDPLGQGFDAATASWSCEVITLPQGDNVCSEAGGTGALDTLVDLAPGGQVRFVLTVDTEASSTGTVTNTATASAEGDIASDTVLTTLTGRAELSIAKTDNRSSLAPGEPIEYVITVENEGPDDVFNARVQDIFPSVIDSVVWSCQAATPVPGDLSPIQVVGQADTSGNDVVVSPDGQHVYVVGGAEDALFAYDRTAVPGANFGDVILLETERNGINDANDPGPAVSGMNNPLALKISGDGQLLYVLSSDVDDGPSIAAFARVSNPAASNFGELTFLGSASENLPLMPTALAITASHIYVSGQGDPDPDAPMGNTSDLLSIFTRDPLSGVPVHDFNRLTDLPAGIAALTVDGPGEYLFAGGDSVAMFSIDPAQNGLPAGRLTLIDSLARAADNMIVAPDAPDLIVRSGSAVTPELAVIRYLDMNGDPLLNETFSYDDNDLPGITGDPLAGAGGIAVAPDGEHLIGVSESLSVAYSFRRDPLSGGLSFQEFLAADVPMVDSNRGLRQATALAFAPDGRHVLIAAAADAVDTNPPLAVLSRRAPDPLFALIETDQNDLNDPNGVMGLRSPNDVAVSPDNRHVYAVSLADNSLVRFSRFPRLGLDEDSAGDHLQFEEAYFDGQGGVQGLMEPRRILVSPDGDSVFVTSEASNTVAVFNRESNPDAPTFGQLTFVEVLEQGVGGVEGIAGAQGMAMDTGSRHLYVAGSFGASIARFSRQPDGSLNFEERVVNGLDGVAGLGGIRSLTLAPDGSQLLGVSTQDNAIVVFDRDSLISSSEFGQLEFVQALDGESAVGSRPVALSIPGGAAEGAGRHVYVAGQNSSTVAVLQRVVDPDNTAFGQVQPVELLTNGQAGIEFMNGPRDVRVSPDGKRVYVAAEFSDAVLVFDRDLNEGGSRFGQLSLVEIRRDSVNGVDGINQVRALAVSGDSRNVYAAGFGDEAIASFRLGVGSVCTAGGSGSIDDRVDIGVGGTLVYRASGVVRPNATDTIENTATIAVPENFVAINPDMSCPLAADYCATDSTMLQPEGRLSIDKTSDQVSVTAGEIARYVVTIENSGPSSLVNDPPMVRLDLSDELDSNPSFIPGSAVWTCEASGSGSLEFDQVWRNLDVMVQGSGPFSRLEGVSDLAAVNRSGTTWLAATSVLANSVSVFSRDPVTGALLEQATVGSGDVSGGQMVDSLDGARSIVASADGNFLYVASRVSDSITVLAVDEAPGGEPELTFVQAVRGFVGLDQAQHLALAEDADQPQLYVVGANDDAIAVFARDEVSGELTWQQSLQQGSGMPAIDGLIDASFIVASPDGEHVYVMSPTLGSVALFDRIPENGNLIWRQTYDMLDFMVGLNGVSAATIDTDGRYLYLSARDANRIVVLERDLSATAARGSLAYSSQVDQGEDGVAGLVGASRIALSGDGNHLYVTSQAGSSVAWFIRDQVLGSLNYAGLRSNLGGSVTGLDGATGLVLVPDLDQLYVAGTREDSIVLFNRTSDSACPASGTGELLNVPFNIGAGGRVTFTIEVEVAGDATGEITNVATLRADQDPDMSVQTSSQNTVVSAEADLAISKDDGLSEFDGLLGATALVGTEQFVYVAGRDDNAVGIFERVNDPVNPAFGDLIFQGAVRSGDEGVEGLNGVLDLTLSVDAAHLYTVSPVDNTLAVFERSAITGQLELIDAEQNGVFGVSGLSGARAISISPDDEHVYVAGEFGNSIAVFSREAMMGAENFGQLEFIESLQNGVDGVAGLGAPVAVAVSDDGLHVYVIGAEEDSIAVFSRNRTAASANFGRLTFVTSYTNNSGGIAGLTGVRDVAVSADGARLYVLGETDGTIARFERDPASGELTFLDFRQDGFSDTVGLTGARSLLLDDAAAELWVAGAAAEAVVRFDVDPMDGSLAFGAIVANGDPAPLTGGEIFGLEGVSGLFVTADGAQLYAASSGRGAVLTFNRNAGMPALDFQQILIDGLGGVAPGMEVTYIITVKNLGPSNVPVARVVDQFPDSFESISWTCSPQEGSGADCLAGGTGDVDTPVSLPTGGRVTIRASGIISAGATGRLINTVTVTAEGVSDPNLANNSATDDDTVLSPAADLQVSVSNGLDQVTPGDSVVWDIVVSNAGPSSVQGVEVADGFPPALFDASWSCVATPQAGILGQPLTSDSMVVPQSIAFSADGRTAFVVGGDSLEVWARDALSGVLSAPQRLQQGIDGVLALQGARDVVITPDGRFVYVAASDSDAISLFEQDAGTQQWAFVDFWQDGQLGIEGLGGVDSLLLTPEGNRLVAASSLDGALAVFEINAADGGLSQIDLLAQGVNGIDGLAGVADLTWTFDENYLATVAVDNQALAVFERNADGTLNQRAVILNDELLGGVVEDALLGAAAVLAVEDELLVAAAASDRIGRFELILPENEEDDLLINPLGVIDGAVLGQAVNAPSDLAFDPDQSRLYVAQADELLLISLLDIEPSLIESYASTVFPALIGLSEISLGPSLRQAYTLGTDMAGEVAAWARERGSRCPLGGEGDIGSNTVDIVAGGFLSYRVEGRVQPNATGTIDYTVSVSNPAEDQELNPADNSATDSDPLVPAPDLQVGKGIDTDPVVAGLPISWSISAANLGISDAIAAEILDELGVFPIDPGGIVADSGVWSCLSNLPLGDPVTYVAPAELQAMALDANASTLVAVSPATDAFVFFPIGVDGVPGMAQQIVDGQVFPVNNGDDRVVQGLNNPQDVVISADGLHAYVAALSGNSVLTFVRDSNADPFVYLQTLTTVIPSTPDSVPGLRGARAVAFSVDERLVFVAGSESNAIAVFERDQDTGELTFIERVADGIGTIVPEFNVIRGVNGLMASGDGSNLYSIAEDSRAISRFTIDSATNTLEFELALREGDQGLGSLDGLQSMTASPGDTQLYILSAAGIQIFSRTDQGELIFDGLFNQIPDLGAPLDLVVDASGSRAYMLDELAGESRIHVLRRDWNDGSLEFWFTQAIAVGNGLDLIQDAARGRVLLTGIGTDLQAYAEQALSRCNQPEGIGDTLFTTLDLGVDGSALFEVDAVLHPSARGQSVNLVTATPASGADPEPANNVATVSAPIQVVSDISVVKTGPSEAVAGTTINYQLVVQNSGPSDALGIGVTDFLPAELSQVNWTCSASPGSSCPASGVDTLDFISDVLVGGQLTIEIEGLIDPAFIGSILNVALLTPEVDSSDPTPGDQRAEWATDVRAEADIAVQKTTLSSPVVAGLPVEYLLTAVNNGPSDAPDVSIEDNLPLPLINASWTCTGLAGAVCPANGSGDPDFSAALPVGSSIEVLVRADVPADATGALFNSVEAQVVAPVTDPDLSNNTADVSDPIEVQVDLVLALMDPLDPFDPAGSRDLPLVATIFNAGPSFASDAVLDVQFSADVLQTAPGCTQPSASTARCVVGTIEPNGTRRLELALDNLPAAPATLLTDAQVSSSAIELNPPDNSVSIDTQLVNGIDLDVQLSNDRNWLEPGEPALWTLRIENIGSIDASNVAVSMPADPLLQDSAWTCTGQSGGACSAGASGDLLDTASLPAGAVVEYLFDAIVDPAVDLSVPQSVLMDALAETDPVSDDINAVNNLAVDDDPVRWVMFEDGFETLGPIMMVTQPIITEESGCFQLTMNVLPFGDARLLQANSIDGLPLFWLDSQRAADSTWLRLTGVGQRAAQTSGWRKADANTAVTIRMVDRLIELNLNDRFLWAAADPLRAQPAWLQQRSANGRSLSEWSTCGTATAGGMR